MSVPSQPPAPQGVGRLVVDTSCPWAPSSAGPGARQLPGACVRPPPRQFGPAQLNVTVYPGQQVTVFYRSPVSAGLSGAIGFHPQKAPGMTAALVLMGVFVLCWLIVLLIV